MKTTVLKNFIVLEGIDGAGTSTQTKLLSQAIKNSKATFEPTDSRIGKLIREVLKKAIVLNPISLAYLFSADRAEHLYGNEGIVAMCMENIVICDRYLFSSLAYQSLDMPFGEVLKLNENFPLPQIVFFINTPLEECEKRIDTRGEEKEIFEKRPIQEKVLENYFKSFEAYKDAGLKLFELDGTKPVNILLEEELSILKKEILFQSI